MHMEALDRSFSSSSHSDGGLSLSSYPLTPEPQLNPLAPYSDHCAILQPEYSNIQYTDNYDFGGSQSSLEPSSPITSSTPTGLLQTSSSLHHQSYPVDDDYEQHRQHLSSTSSRSSYSSNSSCPQLSSSQSSGLSDIPSISNLSISSDASSSSSLCSDPQSSYNLNHNIINNPFIVSNSRSDTSNTTITDTTKNSNRKLGTCKPIRSCQDGSVPRRSSAPARSTTQNNINSDVIRKDSFVYDVQLETDNVLLFVPDLDLVKSHLMFAVREEVDVLKEKIGELMERINHLEYENTVLRKYATQDTLQQLQHNAPNP